MNNIDVEGIAEKASRITSLSRQIEELLNILSEKYLREKKGLVADIFKKIIDLEHPPKLPKSMESNIHVLDRELDRYVNDLQKYIEKISRIAILLERIDEVEKNLRNEINEMIKWSKILRQINPYYYSEALRTVNRCQKALIKPSSRDVKKFLSELEGHLDDLRIKNTFYKRICSKRLNELNNLYGLAIKLYGQARMVADMGQIAILEEKLIEAKKIKEDIDRFMRNMSEEIRLEELRRKLMNIIDFFREIFVKTMGREKSEIFSAISMISKASEGKLLRLDELIEQVSRRTGYSRERVLETIYFLNKRNMLDIRIKIHY